MQRIDAERVCPRSRLFFRSWECVVWTLWFVSLLVGAVAMAVTISVLEHRQYAIFEVTHDSYVAFLLTVLPYVWLVVFGVMLLLAAYNLRHTRYGYRIPLWLVVGSSVAGSVGLGLALQVVGVGMAVDQVLDREMPLYPSQARLEAKRWQDPPAGRLVGVQIYTTIAPSSTVIVRDIAGVEWRVNVWELTPADRKQLASGETVRLWGTTTDAMLQQFHACAVLRWMIESRMSQAERLAERQSFIARTAEYQQRRRGVETHPAVNTHQPLICHELTALERLPQHVYTHVE